MSLRLQVGLFVVALIMAVTVATIAVSVVVDYPGSITIETESNEIRAMQAQVAEMRRSEDRMLLVIISMAGIAATAVVGTFAVATYLFTRLHERDIKFIEKSVNEGFEHQLRDIQEKAFNSRLLIDHRVATLDLKLNDSVSKIYDQLLRQMDIEARIHALLFSQDASIAEIRNDPGGKLRAQLNTLVWVNLGESNNSSDDLAVRMIRRTLQRSENRDVFAIEDLRNAKEIVGALENDERWKPHRDEIRLILEELDEIQQARSTDQGG